MDFCGVYLQWDPAVPQLKALLANKTIIGFGMGDELVWGGVTPSVSAKIGPV